MLIDEKERKRILEDEGSIAVAAGAGAGKTTIMIRKIEKVLDKIKDHKTVAAITFTIKATDNIKENRTKIKKHFECMTNDSFVENEIIRPFLADAYQNNYAADFVVDYSSTYKFQTYEEGLEQLRDKNILGTYNDIKSNFKFELAGKIIEQSTAAQQYLKSKYYMLFIDEYQDSDKDMHDFFMKLKDKLNILLFVVGDETQAIYGWRGALDNIFTILRNNQGFSFYKLTHNFRCDVEIQNYANLFHKPDIYVGNKENVKNLVLSKFTNFKKDLQNLISKGILSLEQEITIIVNINDHIKDYARDLKELGYDFVFIPQTPLDNSLPNGHILKQLAYYMKDNSYSIYDFIEKAVYIDENQYIFNEIDSCINILKESSIIENSTIKEVLLKLAQILKIELARHEIEKFIEAVTTEKYTQAFILSDSEYKIMTVFGAKGLEFDQVISFSSYYNFFNQNKKNNHYVCITRARKKSIMFLNEPQYLEYVDKILKSHSVKKENMYLYI